MKYPLTNSIPLYILEHTMSYAVVTAKVDPQTKKLAMATANSLGIPLSVAIKAFLKQFIRTKTITFNATEEKPSRYLLNMVKKAREDRKLGKVSPVFDNAKDAIDWLHK